MKLSEILRVQIKDIDLYHNKNNNLMIVRNTKQELLVEIEKLEKENQELKIKLDESEKEREALIIILEQM